MSRPHLLAFTTVAGFTILASMVACSSDDRRVVGDEYLPTKNGDTTPNDSTNDLDKMSAEPEDPYTAGATDVVCPPDTVFDAKTGFCVTPDKKAVGPFPDGMVDECKKAGNGAVCDQPNWPVDVAEDARNSNPNAVDDPTIQGDDPVSECPTGTTVSPETGLCTDGKFVYGPFDKTVVDECKANGGGAKCEGTRFPIELAKKVVESLLAIGLGANGQEVPTAPPTGSPSDPGTPPGGGGGGGAGGDAGVGDAGAGGDAGCGGVTPKAVPASLPASCGDGAKLFNHYNDRENYSTVRRQARAALPNTGKRCAAYVSLAMRSVYPDFPMRTRTDAVGSGGPGVKEELIKRGWKPVPAAQCQPGDIGFTQDLNEYGASKNNPKIQGVGDAYRTDAHSGHVFMVADNQNGVLTAIDNRVSDGAYNSGSITNSRAGKTPTAYCFRAPNTGEGCQAVPAAAFCQGKADGFYCDPEIAKAAIQCKGGTRLAGLQCPTGKTCSTGCDGKASLKSETELSCK
jgi:hypothetical protein